MDTLPQKEDLQTEQSFNLVPKTPQSHPELEKLKTLRTYQGDVESTIHRKNESVISIAVAEQKAKSDSLANPEIQPKLSTLPEKKDNIFVTYGVLPLLGIVLIVVGIGAVAGVYYVIHQKNQPLIVQTQNVLIQYSAKKTTLLDELDPRTTIENTFAFQAKSLANSSMSGSILSLEFTIGTSSIISADFLSAIGPSAPNRLLRSLSSPYTDGILTQTLGEQTSQVPFFIFSSASFGDTYAGMLAWESTMSDDLIPFFGSLFTTPTATTTQSLATSTPPQWVDERFNNTEVRIIRDTAGNTRIVYGFIDKNTLIITGNEQSFTNLVQKYINARLVK